MSGLQMPLRDQKRTPGVVRVAGSLLIYWALFGAMLAFFMFLTAGESQACQQHHKASPHVARSTLQVVGQASRTDAASVKVASANTLRGCLGPRRCHGLCCAGSCCPACTAGIVLESWAPTDRDPRCIDTPFFYTSLPSTEFDALFRPPRLMA